MTDKREILKSMLNALINDKPEQAAVDFHNYITPKTREVAGLGGGYVAPAASENSDLTDDAE